MSERLYGARKRRGRPYRVGYGRPVLRILCLAPLSKEVTGSRLISLAVYAYTLRVSSPPFALVLPALLVRHGLALRLAHHWLWLFGSPLSVHDPVVPGTVPRSFPHPFQVGFPVCPIPRPDAFTALVPQPIRTARILTESGEAFDLSAFRTSLTHLRPPCLRISSAAAAHSSASASETATIAM